MSSELWERIPPEAQVVFLEMAETIKRLEARMAELDGERASVFFCNGPQCGQSPTAIRALLKAGFPADKILYYRGGLHDWLTLGLPVEAGE